MLKVHATTAPTLNKVLILPRSDNELPPLAEEIQVGHLVVILMVPVTLSNYFRGTPTGRKLTESVGTIKDVRATGGSPSTAIGS